MLKRLSHQKEPADDPVCGAGSCESGLREADSGKQKEYDIDLDRVELPVSRAHFPAPFVEGLEYSTPARGTWNIVHTGMMIPEAHQIFVCARGCLRGVVLTAAEMDMMDRYSAIEIREENIMDRGIEELMLDGVADILEKLPRRPKAILLFINCQHFFLAYDQDYVYDTLKERFRDIDFIDCYMIPTLRKSGIGPDEKMRMQLYEMLKPQEKDLKQINVIGSNLRLDESCELYSLVNGGGCRLVQIQDCGSYEEYQDMARASLNIYVEPIVRRAAERLEERLDQKSLYLPCSFDYDRIDQNWAELSAWMGTDAPDMTGKRAEADRALEETLALIGDTPVAVDFTFTFLILSFSKLLLEHGFNLKVIFVDEFYPQEKEEFLWIREHHPDVIIAACRRAERRVLPRWRGEEFLAAGQKAAYFTGSDHFVNVVESGGFMGYGGIIEITRLMREAYLEKKDRRALIRRKGYGCLSLI